MKNSQIHRKDYFLIKRENQNFGMLAVVCMKMFQTMKTSLSEVTSHHIWNLNLN